MILDQSITLTFTMLSKVLNSDISDAIKNKQKELRVKRAISKTFVFDTSLMRQHFDCITPHSDSDILSFYNKNTFHNQRQFGSQIYNMFLDMNLTHVLAIAPTQSGKTGSMLALIKEFNDAKATQRVDIDNVFIFTGHSSKEWTEQTKQRFPQHMHERIFHRNQLKTFVNMVKDLNNILIIFDESHIANKYGQTLYSLYNTLGFFNIKRLYSKNVKIVHFTATPDSLLHHVPLWHGSMKVAHMQVPKEYLSVEHYLNNNQIFEAKPLLGNYDNIRQLLTFIDIDDPHYHIIRTPRGPNHVQLLMDFKHTFKGLPFHFISEPQYFRLHKQGVDTLFSTKPLRHTFVFIIDKLRCAKSIILDHVQICYDRFVTKPNYDSVLQGLLGRCTGYHPHTSHIRIFTFKDILFNSNLSHFKNNIFYPYSLF